MKIKVLLLLLFQLASFMMLKADDGPQLPIEIRPGNGENSPRIPTESNAPVCYYDRQDITVWFFVYEGDASVEITNNGNVITTNASTLSPITIPVGTLSYGASVVIDTELGNSYIAVYTN